jgi:hypothetical protein
LVTSQDSVLGLGGFSQRKSQVRSTSPLTGIYSENGCSRALPWPRYSGLHIKHLYRSNLVDICRKPTNIS